MLDYEKIMLDLNFIPFWHENIDKKSAPSI
jgi:hypothetical protein